MPGFCEQSHSLAFPWDSRRDISWDILSSWLEHACVRDSGKVLLYLFQMKEEDLRMHSYISKMHNTVNAVCVRSFPLFSPLREVGSLMGHVRFSINDPKLARWRAYMTCTTISRLKPTIYRWWSYWGYKRVNEKPLMDQWKICDWVIRSSLPEFRVKFHRTALGQNQNSINFTAHDRKARKLLKETRALVHSDCSRESI